MTFKGEMALLSLVLCRLWVQLSVTVPCSKDCYHVMESGEASGLAFDLCSVK